jgi:hypothetical protein
LSILGTASFTTSTLLSKRLVAEYSEGNAIYTNESFTKDSLVTPIMIVGVDSIPTRKLIFDKWYEEYGKKEMFDSILIDGRLGLESYQIFTLLPGTKQLEDYKNIQLSDEGLLDTPCTLKATTHVAQILAARMVSILTNWLCGKDSVRMIPYYFREDLNTLSIERRLYVF